MFNKKCQKFTRDNCFVKSASLVCSRDILARPLSSETMLHTELMNFTFLGSQPGKLSLFQKHILLLQAGKLSSNCIGHFLVLSRKFATSAKVLNRWLTDFEQ